jgi:soluble lytic murein transglycosylase-like protein
MTVSVLATGFLFASPTSANVFEISRDGSVSIRSGAGAAIWQSADEQAARSDEPAINTIVPTTSSMPPQRVTVPERFAGPLELAARSTGISPNLLAALVWQESRWNPQALSPKGAMGLAQLMPATARELGVDPRDPVANLMGGARYLRRMLDIFGGDVEKALAGYNAGPGRVRRANGVPAIAETQAYVRSIVQRVSSIRQEIR